MYLRTDELLIAMTSWIPVGFFVSLCTMVSTVQSKKQCTTIKSIGGHQCFDDSRAFRQLGMREFILKWDKQKENRCD